MARTMLDEMVEVLKTGGVGADRIGRYKAMWHDRHGAGFGQTLPRFRLGNSGGH
jgi:hypothetical protein